jgi:peroxiredoxin Q/BCP
MGQELGTGDPAPDFTLPNDAGTPVALRGFRGRQLILYFYPRADTAGCTKEALAFAALQPKLAGLGVTIVGVSADPIAKQRAFKAKYGFDLTLLSDERHDVLKAYGVWRKKFMYGRTFMGISRTTFLIAPDGRIARVWRNVKVPGHAEEVFGAAAGN